MTHRPVLTSTSIVFLLATTLAGCEVTAKTTERYEAEPQTEELDYQSGTDLFIDARNGTINVEPGESGVVRVTFTPFTYRGYDEDDQAQAEMENSLTARAELTDAGIEVATLKEGGGSSSLGADIVVELPPEFDAGLFIDQGNGDVDINTVGEAVELVVRNDGVGSCRVEGAPSVVYTELWCSEVSVEDVSDCVDIRADGLNGNVFVSLAGISGTMPNDHDESVIYTADGDIVLELPRDDAFVVEAQAFGDGGIVNEGPVPEACAVDDPAENAKTVTCGTGPTIDVQAGVDDLGAGNVELRYR